MALGDEAGAWEAQVGATKNRNLLKTQKLAFMSWPPPGFFKSSSFENYFQLALVAKHPLFPRYGFVLHLESTMTLRSSICFSVYFDDAHFREIKTGSSFRCFPMQGRLRSSSSCLVGYQPDALAGPRGQLLLQLRLGQPRSVDLVKHEASALQKHQEKGKVRQAMGPWDNKGDTGQQR